MHELSVQHSVGILRMVGDENMHVTGRRRLELCRGRMEVGGEFPSLGLME